MVCAVYLREIIIFTIDIVAINQYKSIKLVDNNI